MAARVELSRLLPDPIKAPKGAPLELACTKVVNPGASPCQVRAYPQPLCLAIAYPPLTGAGVKLTVWLPAAPRPPKTKSEYWNRLMLAVLLDKLSNWIDSPKVPPLIVS